MYPTRNDLPAPVRSQVCEQLQGHLALLIDLKLQTKQAHWNVKGENFIALHELFDKVASDVDEYVDTVAERMVQLGGQADGLAKSVAQRSTLPPYPMIENWVGHVTALSNSLAFAGKTVRKAIDDCDRAGDKDSADLLTAVSRGLDKWLWMVEAHLAPQK
jgi:starvation-inducible DNA-binding protein